MNHSEYLQEIFEPQKIVDAFKLVVPRDYAKRENIVYVGTGLSGTAALFILKQAGLIDRIAIVRKGENSHALFNIEISHDIDVISCHWVFVDDMIAEGKTFRKCLERFNSKGLIGCMLYHFYPKWRTAGNLLKKYTIGDRS